MSTYTDKTKKASAALRMAAYLLIVAFVFAAISFLCKPETSTVITPESGVLDLKGVDFREHTVIIASESFTMYPGAFYLPKDFAEGLVAQNGARYNSPGNVLGDYGTLRLELRLPRGEIYALASKNASYAQRLFIDGKEYAAVGVTGESIDTVVPETRRYVECFAASDDTTEIVLHYSAFVYSDGGGLYPLELGLVRNMVRSEQLKTFRIAAVSIVLLTAMLFFFGLFLFFPKDLRMLWFALICGCVSLRSLLISDKVVMLLLPNLDWLIAIRLEQMLTYSIALFSALYLNSLFPRAANRWAIRGFIVLCLSAILLICLTPPIVFSRFTGSVILLCSGFFVLILLFVLIAVLRKKTVSLLSGAEQILLLFGLTVYAALSIAGISAHQNSMLLFGLDYPNVGMSIFLFLNMLALVLGFARTERTLDYTQRELDEARRSERETEETNRMLARLNRVKSDFLDNISHEMKTPLTVIGGYAGVAITQLKMNAVDEGTYDILDFIQQEAVALGRLVEQLKEVSLEKERQLTLTDTDTEALFKRASNACASLCRKEKNKIVIQPGVNRIPLRVDADGIYRVLVNLISNAACHTKGGKITLGAELSADVVVITVKDTGEGIAPALMDSLFERGVSGGGGRGLGLTICRAIVEEHGGKIELLSEYGKGTTVRFTLPAAKGREQT